MEKGLFDGISDAERGKMLSCFGAQYKSYQVEDVIADYSRGTNRVGILQSGKANLERLISTEIEPFSKVCKRGTSLVRILPSAAPRQTVYALFVRRIVRFCLLTIRI